MISRGLTGLKSKEVAQVILCVGDKDTAPLLSRALFQMLQASVKL